MAADEITWVARAVPDEGLPAALTMAEALGFAVLASDEHAVMLQTPRGDVLEYCGPDHPVPPHLFAEQDTVVGFRVDDLDASTQRLATAGLEPIGVATASGAIVYQHFRGPAGRVYGLLATGETVSR